MNKETVGCNKEALSTVSIKADIDILPNIQKTSDAQSNFCMMKVVDEIGVGWMRKGETSNKEYVCLSIAAPEFGPKKLYGNFGLTAFR